MLSLQLSMLAYACAGSFALAEALARGRPYMAEVNALAEGCQDDHLVIVALTSVPQDYAETVGVCTAWPRKL